MKINTPPVIRCAVSTLLSGDVFKHDSDYYMVVCPLRKNNEDIPVVNLKTGLMELMSADTKVKPLPDAALQP